jgi:hypothetical protein
MASCPAALTCNRKLPSQGGQSRTEVSGDWGYLRQASILTQSLEDAHQAIGVDRSVHLEMQDLAVEVVRHVEQPVAPAVQQTYRS